MWLRSFWPAPSQVAYLERGRAALGALIGIMITAVVATSLGSDNGGALWIVAPMGATAVLVFAVPSGPLSQPWAVVGGNTLSALFAVTTARLIDVEWLAASVAVGGAIGLMFVTRCLHPPGGASALLMVLIDADYGYVWFPVVVNSLLLVAAAIVYNTLTRRTYPNRQMPASTAAARGQGPMGPTNEDLDAALAGFNSVLDVSREDLRFLVQQVQLRSYTRRLRELRCGDVMRRDPLTATEQTLLRDAWGAMHRRRVKAMPVLDRWGAVVGVVTPSDFIRHAGMDEDGRLLGRLRAMLRRRRGGRGPETVGRIMTRQPVLAAVHQPLVDLVPMFANTGHRAIPVVGHDGRLVGLITETDMVVALATAAEGEAQVPAG